GSVEADAGRGLSLRMDHGSQYRSDDFRAQLKFWGITPSYAFVAEPQTNGVAERFNRTMKEQAIHGRPFNNVEEVRAAAGAFKDRYNGEWRLEKPASRHPSKAVMHRSCHLSPDRKIVSKQPGFGTKSVASVRPRLAPVRPSVVAWACWYLPFHGYQQATSSYVNID
ncbi:MAG: integrase core domain-containing protein, partial [Burkholderia sp.]